MNQLRAPFPYYGYKGQVSGEIWSRLGDVPNYVEPFFGSGAVLLQRPGGAGSREVVNDKSGHLCNFWRAVKADPEGVADHAVHVASESDLHARNAYCREVGPELTAHLEGHPGYYDEELAGWWVYVQCLAIGEAAFARGPWVRLRDELNRDILVNEGAAANGIRRAVPCDGNRGIQKSIPFHGQQGLFSRRRRVSEWLKELRDRLSEVRILCGDWSRIVKPTYTVQHGLTGAYLDPPYQTHYKLYGDSDPLVDEITAWCLSVGENPLFRIVLSCYDGTFPALVEAGWTVHEWTARGGRVTTGGQSDENRRLERLLCSPHCLRPEEIEQLDLLWEADRARLAELEASK